MRTFAASHTWPLSRAVFAATASRSAGMPGVGVYLWFDGSEQAAGGGEIIGPGRVVDRHQRDSRAGPFQARRGIGNAMGIVAGQLDGDVGAVERFAFEVIEQRRGAAVRVGVRVGESGFGSIHGPDGLREFTRPKAITRQRFPLPFGMQSFDRPGFVLPAVRQAMKLRHGRAPRRHRR